MIAFGSLPMLTHRWSDGSPMSASGRRRGAWVARHEVWGTVGLQPLARRALQLLGLLDILADERLAEL